jgi:hypothetical protein
MKRVVAGKLQKTDKKPIKTDKNRQKTDKNRQKPIKNRQKTDTHISSSGGLLTNR